MRAVTPSYAADMIGVNIGKRPRRAAKVERPAAGAKTSTGIAGGFSFSGCKPSYYRQRASRACDDLAVTHLLLVTRKRVVQVVYAHLA